MKNKLNCASCDKIISEGVTFKCPSCAKMIVRCKFCKKLGVKYKCECGFEGP
jgi:hypothetical protein